ncbi:MAG: PH domain-containing protein [Clostridiales bacterium]|nr:PH domain-containing protein [Clostridiales bacterium]
MESIEYLWKDRKRRLGLPLSFTRYLLSDDRLFCETGLLNLKADEVLLYRVQDLELTMTLGQRIFGVGTVCVHSSDKSMPHLDLKNVKHPRQVKELIHQNVEQAKERRRMRATELLGRDGGPAYHDGDELDFVPDEDDGCDLD